MSPYSVRNVLIIRGFGRRNTRPASAGIYQTPFLIGSSAQPLSFGRFCPPLLASRRSRPRLENKSRAAGLVFPLGSSRPTPCAILPSPLPPPPFLVSLLSRFTLSSARRPLSLKRHSMRLAFGYCVGHCRDIELDDPYDVNGPVEKEVDREKHARERGERKIAAMKRAAQNARERGIGHIYRRAL